jgi:hypothetical protein
MLHLSYIVEKKLMEELHEAKKYASLMMVAQSMGIT